MAEGETVGIAMNVRHAIIALLLGAVALISGCQTQPAEQSTANSLEKGYPVDFPKLTCARYGKPNGAAAKLTASRVTPGAPAYIEFRQRFSPAIPSGHLFVVFGRLDASGKPATRQYIGLYPKGGLVGLYGGAIVEMDAVLEPSSVDCGLGANAAYRVSLTEGQYQTLLRKVSATLAHPPKWRMFGFNCNNFAASMGSVAGLREPANRNLPSFAYIYAFIDANGDGRKGKAPS
ncbi:MAG: hypothetical protein JNL61_20160 [Rhizobiaceae bacterium]|nr:hypothetical protein [Rhizobiaceae bacterium]